MKTPGKTVGVYERPAKARWPRIAAVILVLLVAIVVGLIFVPRFFSEARGHTTVAPAATGLVSSLIWDGWELHRDYSLRDLRPIQVAHHPLSILSKPY